jgi:hypothetical protein
MSSSIAAASSIGVKANALTRVSKRAINSKPAVVCSASSKSDDVAVGSSQDAVTRRQALAAGAAVTATLGASTPALAGLLDGALDGALTLGGGDVMDEADEQANTFIAQLAAERRAKSNARQLGKQPPEDIAREKASRWADLERWLRDQPPQQPPLQPRAWAPRTAVASRPSTPSQFRLR